MGFCAAGSIGKILKKSSVHCVRSDLPDLGCYPILEAEEALVPLLIWGGVHTTWQGALL